jgi:hypothetical protein
MVLTSLERTRKRAESQLGILEKALRLRADRLKRGESGYNAEAEEALNNAERKEQAA